MAAAGATGVLLATGDRRTPPAVISGPSSPPVRSVAPVPLDGSGSAQDWLDHLADLVRQRPDSPTIGRYAYTRVRFWSRETTPTGRDGDAKVEEEQLWWDENLSGLRVSIRTDQGDDVSEPHPYPAGGLPVVVRFPSADPTILAQQLDREQPPQVGPVGRLRAVADLNLFHPLDRQQRVAVLTVLADTRGLSYRGAARDRAGRAGVAISADLAVSGPYQERVTLAFDMTTGELLSQETSRLADSGAPDPADGATSSYVLYLERLRTDRLG
jgi:hypothetical protein